MTKTLKALLVGQNDDNLSLLKETLGADDLEITATAGLGPAALTWARSTEPDVVVVIADESIARPVAVTQSLTLGDPAWTVVVLAERFERELVRQAMLAGARDVLVRTSPAEELRAALATARRADLARRGKADDTAGSTAGTIVSLVGVKGGIGKTTTSVNLAVSLAQETGRSVALVDLDLPFGDLAMMLNLRPTGSVLAALADPATLDDPDLLQRQLCPGPAGVHVLPAPLGATGSVADSAQVGPMLNRLAGLYDFVVVDTMGGFGEFTAAVLDSSTQTMMMTTPEGPTLRRTELGIRQLAAWNYPSPRLKVVVNRTSLKTGIAPEEVADILSQPVAWWLVEEPAALQAAAIGEPLVLVQPKSQLSLAYRSIARQLAGLPALQKRSIWSSLFTRKPAPALAGAF
ncbi:MAG: AAA family ATPase [Chloroflexi bacterium]|nr:AAA family ATPase [Chloroflexota bacterium]